MNKKACFLKEQKPFHIVKSDRNDFVKFNFFSQWIFLASLYFTIIIYVVICFSTFVIYS